MAKRKLPKFPFPEMEALLEGMQDLLTDENGNPLPPDHPQVQKFNKLAEHMSMTFSSQTDDTSPFSNPQSGTA
ncbi:MAG: hypothetical protein D6704_06300 [Nitrospirae bacterium]|nr:MAG: hypothetical protein D6704_06300 [Nitrospirota bacterium]